MSNDPAYGPLCSTFSRLRREMEAASADLAICRRTEINCTSLQKRLSDIGEKVSRCQTRMLGMSYGMRACCQDRDRDE